MKHHVGRGEPQSRYPREPCESRRAPQSRSSPGRRAPCSRVLAPNARLVCRPKCTVLPCCPAVSSLLFSSLLFSSLHVSSRLFTSLHVSFRLVLSCLNILAPRFPRRSRVSVLSIWRPVTLAGPQPCRDEQAAQVQADCTGQAGHEYRRAMRRVSQVLCNIPQVRKRPPVHRDTVVRVPAEAFPLRAQADQCRGCPQRAFLLGAAAFLLFLLLIFLGHNRSKRRS